MGLSQIVGQVTGMLLAILISDDYLQPFLILLISIIYNAKIFNFFDKTAQCAIKTIIFDINSGVLAQPFKMAFSIAMVFDSWGGFVLDTQWVARCRNVLPNSLDNYSTISSAGVAMLPAGCSSAESVYSSGTSCGMLPSSGCLLYCYGNIIFFVFTCHSKLKNLTYYFHLIDVHMKKGAIMPYLAEAWVDSDEDAGGASVSRCGGYLPTQTV